jgi:hypothetical protein
MSSILLETKVLYIIKTTHETLQRNKENMYKVWAAFLVPYVFAAGDVEPPPVDVMHPALKAAFEADYPPKHPEHMDLNIYFTNSMVALQKRGSSNLLPILRERAKNWSRQMSSSLDSKLSRRYLNIYREVTEKPRKSLAVTKMIALKVPRSNHFLGRLKHLLP